MKTNIFVFGFLEQSNKFQSLITLSSREALKWLPEAILSHAVA